MYNAGDFNLTETVHLPLNSFSSDDPTASVTITNLAAGDIEIHKDGSATQRASDNGVTVSVDFDSVTGNHMIHIDLSDDTDSGFYSNGSRYLVRIEGVTVDSGTLNAWIGGFSIGCVLRPTTAGRTLDIETGGCAGVDWGNVANQSTSVDLSATAIDLVDECTVNTDMRGTDSAYTGTPPTVSEIRTEIDSNSTQLAAIVADTDEMQADLENGGRVDLLIDSIISAISALNNISVSDILSTTLTEPADLTDKTLEGILYHLFSRFFHRNTNTATQQITYKEDGVTALATRTTSDDGTTQVLGAGS